MTEHAHAMDAKYRYVRHIYDLTRLPFLLGRNRAINVLGNCNGKTVLEIGCGTGRNLDILARRFPLSRLYGIDISVQMLGSSRSKLKGLSNVKLMQADAETFNSVRGFGVEKFDRILMSFSLSMIPDWKKAFLHALSLLERGGVISIVEFGNFNGFGTLKSWAINELGRHQAPPIVSLHDDITSLISGQTDLSMTSRTILFGFVQFVVLQKM